MNNQTFENLNLFFQHYIQHKSNLKIIDIGSRIRTPAKIEKLEKIFKKHEYIGVDLVEGQNVDVVLEDPYVYPFSDNELDIVVANNIFEHSEHFWLLFLELIRILKPDGLLYTNSPSNGHYHRGSFDQDLLIDAYRFYPDSGMALQKWANRSNFENLIMLESYTFKRRDSNWNDYIAIFLKDKNYIENYPHRIIDNMSHFYNGFSYNNKEPRNFQIKTEDQILLDKRAKVVFLNFVNKIIKYLKKTIKTFYKLLNND